MGYGVKLGATEDENNKEKKKEKHRLYYEKNKEKKRLYREKNKEKHKKYMQGESIFGSREKSCFR